MSDKAIEIGDFWITKKSPIECEVIGLKHGNKVPIITSYSAEDDCTDTCTQFEFLRDYEFLRKGSESESDKDWVCSGCDKPVSDCLCLVDDDGLMTGRKDDSSKLRYSLLPVGTVNQVVQVLEYGASDKYEIDNWQKVPSARIRYYDAAMRHIDAWWNGELLDLDKGDQKGSHLPHLAHAICCLMFLMWFDSEAADD